MSTRRYGVPSAASYSSVPVMRRCMSSVDVVLRLPEEVLAAPAEVLDAPSDERVDERRGRQRLAPPGIGDLQRLQRATLDQRRELAADRLDLGKLGHGNRG